MNSKRQDLVVMLDAPELGEIRPVGVLTRWPGAILIGLWKRGLFLLL